MKSLTDAVIVSVSFSDENKGVMCVGRKAPGKDVEVINAFADEEAMELYKKLITPKKKEG